MAKITKNDIFIDYETYATVDLRTSSAYVYADHHETDVICMAWAIGNGPVKLWLPGDKLPSWLFDLEGKTIHAHNANFERLITKGVCVKKFGFPEIPEETWCCTAAMAAAAALPRSLDGAAKALGTTIQKDGAGKKDMLRLCKPVLKKGKRVRITKDMEPDRYETTYRYCKNDVSTEREIYKKLPRLNEIEEKVYHMDARINDRGIPIDIEEVRAGIRLCDRFAERKNEELAILTDGSVKTATQSVALTEWLNEQGVDTDNVRKATVDELLDGDLPDLARDVLEIRRALGKSSVKKLQAMERWNSHGHIRGTHLYHGASTGRFAGKGVQTQNFVRGYGEDWVIDSIIRGAVHMDLDEFLEVHGEPFDEISSCIRGFLKAPEGHQFLVCDFASIEARVLAWLAGETVLLNDFYAGIDPYVSMAADIYGKPNDAVTKSERMLGKIAILGLGYGMGGTKFKDTVAAWGGGEIEEEFAKDVVKLYRERNENIKKFWYAQDRAFKQAIEHPGDIVGEGAVYWKYDADEEFARVTLPSGRRLSYYQPQIKLCDPPWRNADGSIPDKIEQTTIMTTDLTRKWTRQKTYGGKLAENLTQAVARDLLVSAMNRVETNGLEVVFHVHDELVVLAPDAAEASELERLMKLKPAWATGCPVDAVAESMKRYRK